MKFYYALALYLMTTFSLLAQTEVPLYNNAVLQRAHAIKQQAMGKKGIGDDYTQARFDVNCAEELPTLHYLIAGEEIGFFVDTFDLDGAGGMIRCLNCEDQNFGTATLDTTSLQYVSNGDVIAGIDTILVEFCTANNETCFTFDYPILVKREGMSRTDPIVTLVPEESTFYTIDIEGLPGDFACANQYDCNDNYEGEPYMWVSQSKPYEFFYEASLYKGTDMVCFVICDNFTICDTVNIPFSITQGNASLQPPFLDDFSYEGPYPDKSLWLDLDIYINKNFATKPPSVGVATFDGLDKNGKPYGGGFGKSDLLTSTYIDLSQSSTNQNLYLSFWLQQQGLGDRPEADDTMQLHYKNKDGEWVDTIAVLNGVSSSVSLSIIPGWQFYAFPIQEEDFLHDDFQFRFVNLGSRTGALDIWNLDYVRLAPNANSPNINDIAFTARPSNILKNYTSLPWAHFEANPTNEVVDHVDFGLYNHQDEPISPTNSELIIREKQTGQLVMNPITTLFDAIVIPSDTCFLGNNSIALSTSPFNGRENVEFETTYTLDFGQLETDGYEAVLRNDTVSRTTIFDNYFAHDDGTAESNIVAQNFANQSVQIAVQFTANVEDCIHAFQMHIPHVTGNVNSQLFNFKIWEATTNDDGQVVPMEDHVYQMTNIRPEYLSDYRGDSLQGFTTYPLLKATGEADTFCITPGNFFIGWEQTVPCQGTSCLPVGYDKNTPDAARFNWRNRNGDGWERFPVAIPDGALMIRPVVGSVRPGPTDVEDIVKTAHPIKVFPNPATDRIQLQLLEGDYQDYQLAIFNNTGQLVHQLAMTQELNLSHYQNGIYFLKITNLRTQTISNHKIIVIK